MDPPPAVDEFYTPGHPLVGDCEARRFTLLVIVRVGVCLAVRSADRLSSSTLFVGDTLFAGSIGRTETLPGGDHAT